MRNKKNYIPQWHFFSQRIKADRGNICEQCGAHKSKNLVLNLHHKNYDPSDNSKNNLVVLCQSCHMKQTYKDAKVTGAIFCTSKGAVIYDTRRVKKIGKRVNGLSKTFGAGQGKTQ